MTVITLTPDQEKALEQITAFITDDSQSVFVLEGYSGTGKSTLVRTVIDKYSDLSRATRLIDPNHEELELVLTATTNKACEALQSLTKRRVSTIHSLLGLRVRTDYKTGKTTLTRGKGAQLVTDSFIVIDEASFIDSGLLGSIHQYTHDCKILFIGDPAQLSPVKSANTPVFNAGFPTAKLSKVVRQEEGNQIIELSSMFRDTVNTGEFFSFVPDEDAILHLSRDEFNQEVLNEFTRDDWNYNDSKVLAWTNKTVIAYNHGIRKLAKGEPQLHEGDYAVCNGYVHKEGENIKTDTLVQIDYIKENVRIHGVEGRIYILSGHAQSYFSPYSLEDKKEAIKKYKEKGDYVVLHEIDSEWIDLRAAYSCTINKSQGSTFDRVFIDLDDIAKCNNGNTIARMMYVAVSRARNQVIFTGDFG